MAARLRPDAQEHGPRAAIPQGDKVSMSGCLNRMPATKAMAEHWIVRTRRKRSEGRIGPRGDLTMAVGGAALGSQQVDASMQGVQVRPLGPHTTRATPDCLHFSPQTTGICIQFGLFNHRMIEVCPSPVARVVDAAVVEE